MAIEVYRAHNSVGLSPLELDLDLIPIEGIQAPSQHALRRSGARFSYEGESVGYLPLQAYAGDSVDLSDPELSSSESESSDGDWSIGDDDETDELEEGETDSASDIEEDSLYGDSDSYMALSPAQNSSDEEVDMDESSDCQSVKSVTSSFETWDGESYENKRSDRPSASTLADPAPAQGGSGTAPTSVNNGNLQSHSAGVKHGLSAEVFFASAIPKSFGPLRRPEKFKTSASRFAPRGKSLFTRSPLSKSVRGL
ncbi:hypothetical protein DFP72DRAFT_1067289 [Ephemerocybe angulata]|uniref:Uncharacterized protein n=1 Tax=Ephemerocybe angulata TaxID=980116 RepID=A0A8H6HZS6_9AGAR|nr:hypothetical protein DFP72DRAFT_1067289 [Tulosesus angulatus]